MARIFITGGTGFVGGALLPHLIGRGHQLVLLAREGERINISPGVTAVIGDSTKPGPWWDELKNCDAAINMAGTPIVGRWNADRKKQIRESRLLTTKNLVDALPDHKPFTLFSTSAVGVYGNAGEAELTEDAPPGTDYLAQVAVAWEREALRAKDKGARVVIGRFGIVLGTDGGAFPELVKNAKTLRGGPVGSGKQWISWIHREDLIRAIADLVENPQAQGVYNLCSPQPVRQGDLAQAIGKRLGMPTPPAPAFLVRLLLGEMADIVLFSQRMAPRRLVESGFAHRFPTVESALNDLLP